MVRNQANFFTNVFNFLPMLHRHRNGGEGGGGLAPVKMWG